MFACVQTCCVKASFFPPEPSFQHWKNEMPAVFVEHGDKTPCLWQWPVGVGHSCGITERMLVGQWWAPLCIIMFWVSAKLFCSCCAPVLATYIIGLQLDSVFKDVRCEAGFLEDFIERGFILRNTHRHTNNSINSQSGSTGSSRLQLDLLAKLRRRFSCLHVCLTASLSSPSVSALWPNRASAVSWKHVTHWLSPKSAKLAWVRNRQRLFIYVCLCEVTNIHGGYDIPHHSICHNHYFHLYSAKSQQTHQGAFLLEGKEVPCAYLQKVRVCIWSWGILCYTSRSGTVRCAGPRPSCCSLQMDRPGTDNSPYECTALSPRSWNTAPEKWRQKEMSTYGGRARSP